MYFLYMIRLLYVYLLATVFVPLLFMPLLLLKLFIKINVYKVYMKFMVEYVFKVKFIVAGDKCIDRGLLISNHTSFVETSFDPYLNNCAGIGRKESFMASLFAGILAYAEDYVIWIDRKTMTKERLIKRIKKRIKTSKVKTALIYPQGTRYPKKFDRQTLVTMFKHGTVKKFYLECPEEPVQVVIKLNCENVMSLKKHRVNFNETVVYYRTKPFYPKDYNTYEMFFEEILSRWSEGMSFCEKKIITK